MGSNGNWTGQTATGTNSDWSGGALTFGVASAPWALAKYAVTTICVGDTSTLTDSDGSFLVSVVQNNQAGDPNEGTGLSIVVGNLRPGDALTLDSRETFFISLLSIRPVLSDGTTTDTSAALNYHLQGHTSSHRATV